MDGADSGGEAEMKSPKYGDASALTVGLDDAFARPGKPSTDMWSSGSVQT